jgi:transcriptional regulator with XRE-family HTH domain
MPDVQQDIRVIFSQRLKAERIKQGLSVTELSQKSGVSRKHIYELESGLSSKRCTILTLSKLAKALKITPSKLLDS